MLTNKSLLGRKVSKLLPIAALLLVAITIQILVLRAGRIHWTSDQAVVAIMARDIVQRGAHPVFYYGSAYAGSLEPHWVAFCFALFGVSITTYHLAMIALLVVLLCIVYGTTRTAFSRPVALLAVGYLALPPYFFLYKGLTSDGAYDAVAILGAFLLYAALRLEASIRQSGKVRLWVTVLGLAAGMGWWVDPLIVYFYLAVLAWFVVVRPSVFLQLSFYPFFIGAFLMGGFPWWVNNIRFSWHSLTAPELAAAPQGQIINQFAGFWKLGLPIILASRPVFNRVDTYGGESIVSAVLYLVPTFLLLFYVLKHRKLLRSKPVGEIPAQARTLLLLLLPLLIVPCLVAVNNRSDLSEPRYLFALYAFYPIAFGFSIWKLGKSGLWPGRLLAAALVALALFSSGRGLFLADRYDDYVDRTNNGPLTDLIEKLQERRLKSVYASYWVAYRLNFESGERVIATPFGLWRFTRMSRYQQSVSVDPHPAFVLCGPEADEMLKYLRSRKACFSKFTLPPFEVFYDLTPGALEPLRQNLDVPKIDGSR